jgi:hypothetical protein
MANPILVRFAEGGEIKTLYLFDVKWVEAIYYRDSHIGLGSRVVYRVTTNDDRMVIIPREAIGRAYYEQKSNEGVTATYYDKATKIISEVGSLCQLHQESKTLDHPIYWEYARWAKEKLGVVPDRLANTKHLVRFSFL